VIGAAVRMPHRGWLVTAGASVWLSMMITPQGENLFLEVWPTVTTAAASVAATYAVLGFERGRERGHRDDGPPTLPMSLPLVEPALVEPAPTGPALTGPALTGPALTGPAPTGPAPTGPALTGPALTGPAVAPTAR
jgi:hypothetical protein